MKRMKQEANLVSRPMWAVAALVIAITAVRLYGESRPNAQPSSAETKCMSTQSPAAEAANTPMTAAQGAAILRELRTIRLLLQNGATAEARARRSFIPQPVKMRIKPSWYRLGRASAPVTMVEFTDLQCPFCRRFEMTTFAELKKDYIDTGKLRFITRDLPLPMHPYALEAAEAARCAGDQGKFWQFRAAVLDDQALLTSDVLLKHARQLKLNLQQFQACLNSGKYKHVIQANEDDAAALGLRGTPAFVIGRAKSGWIGGLAMQGARPFSFFQQEIETMLNRSSPGSVQTQAAGSAP